MDVLCQAKSGMGKTAVFVCATLQQVEAVNGETAVVVLCHTRELAFQIKNEYARFSKYMPDVRTAVFYGGVNINQDKEILKNKEKCPHIIVATPGRLNALIRDKAINLATVKNFVLDECDKMLESVGQSPSLFGSPRPFLAAHEVCNLREPCMPSVQFFAARLIEPYTHVTWLATGFCSCSLLASTFTSPHHPLAEVFCRWHY